LGNPSFRWRALDTEQLKRANARCFRGQNSQKTTQFFLSPSKEKDFFGKAEEKIGKAEDFLGLLFLSPCLTEDFSGKAEDFFSKAKEKIG